MLASKPIIIGFEASMALTFNGKKRDCEKIETIHGSHEKWSIQELIEENIRWGYTSLRDRMWKLGYDISRSIVVNILKRNGIEPAPKRKGQLSWKEFLESNWECLVAGDFFTVDIIEGVSTVRYYVLFFIEVSTRRVCIAGITKNPTSEYLTQLARNMTDPFDGFFLGKTRIILDNDKLFTPEFKGTITSFGLKFIKIPRKSPNLNAYAERFVRSVRQDCLNNLVLFNYHGLRHALKQYSVYYNRERNHQGIDSKIIRPYTDEGAFNSPIEMKSRLGGMLKYYYRTAV
jgi:putative transposase